MRQRKEVQKVLWRLIEHRIARWFSLWLRFKLRARMPLGVAITAESNSRRSGSQEDRWVQSNITGRSAGSRRSSSAKAVKMLRLALPRSYNAAMKADRG